MSIACSIVCITLMVSDRRWFTRKFRTCSNYRLSKTFRAGNQTKSYDTLHHGRGLLTRQVKHQVLHRSIDIITEARNAKESVYAQVQICYVRFHRSLDQCLCTVFFRIFFCFNGVILFYYYFILIKLQGSKMIFFCPNLQTTWNFV